jgi:hypothetical protein
MSTPMSPDEYAATGYNRCPVCQGGTLSGEPIEIDGRHAWQDVYCQDCEATWQDWYVLQGYDNLDTTNVKETNA